MPLYPIDARAAKEIRRSLARRFEHTAPPGRQERRTPIAPISTRTIEERRADFNSNERMPWPDAPRELPVHQGSSLGSETRSKARYMWSRADGRDE